MLHIPFAPVLQAGAIFLMEIKVMKSAHGKMPPIQLPAGRLPAAGSAKGDQGQLSIVTSNHSPQLPYSFPIFIRYSKFDVGCSTFTF